MTERDELINIVEDALSEAFFNKPNFDTPTVAVDAILSAHPELGEQADGFEEWLKGYTDQVIDACSYRDLKDAFTAGRAQAVAGNALKEALEEIKGMGFDMPRTLDLTKTEWAERRGFLMQQIANEALILAEVKPS
ncbi:MAG: hypothetical protein COA96_10285 [SAR86 cluster bacterium]|uniref:Uncharacterized protein n=1 Tax=SAR86 cluster bacterium TaxID=2030880 RepID=A0A2A5AXU4_9GAMM|nr:MAG: hypothetical protein COA96_10285 [SAR86 cluster bacterium]